MVDAVRFERAGIPAVVIGLPQLLETVGRATARTNNVEGLRFVHIPGGLKHALDYVDDDSDFWATCVAQIVPLIVDALTESPSKKSEPS